jgi:hypothetical protein
MFFFFFFNLFRREETSPLLISHVAGAAEEKETRPKTNWSQTTNYPLPPLPSARRRAAATSAQSAVKREG